MAHVQIYGMTESGKTTLARGLAAKYKAAGCGVIVLDPLADPRWQCDFITADQDEFLDVFWNSRKCMVFIDEGSESVGRYDLAMQQCVTKGRHWGHTCHIISQKATQIAPVVREQCAHLFLFCCALSNGKVLAEDFNKPELIECINLRQGEYIHAVRFGKTTFSNRGKSHDSDSNRGRAGSNDTGVVPESKEETTRVSTPSSGDETETQDASV